MGGVEFKRRLSYNFRTSLGEDSAEPQVRASSIDRVTLLNEVYIYALTSLHISISYKDCGDAEEGKMQQYSGVICRCFRVRAQPHFCLMQDKTGVTYTISAPPVLGPQDQAPPSHTAQPCHTAHFTTLSSIHHYESPLSLMLINRPRSSSRILLTPLMSATSYLYALLPPIFASLMISFDFALSKSDVRGLHNYALKAD